MSRTGRLSHWKGLAYPNTAFDATHATFLAMRGVTGPLEVFEGNKGFMEAIADWQQEHLDAVRDQLWLFKEAAHKRYVLRGGDPL